MESILKQNEKAIRKIVENEIENSILSSTKCKVLKNQFAVNVDFLQKIECFIFNNVYACEVIFFSITDDINYQSIMKYVN